MSVTFVLVACGEKFEPYVSLGSLMCQINPNWKAIVYHNGPTSQYKTILDTFLDPRISYKESAQNTGYWGCYNRIDALKSIDTDYVVQSSIQDYWLPNAVEEIVSRNEDIVYWDSIHHSFGFNRLDCQLQPGMVDWGSVAVQSDIARVVGINYPQEYVADGLFVRDCLGQVKTVHKIPRILTIKN